MQPRWAVYYCCLLSAMLVAALPVSAQETVRSGSPAGWQPSSPPASRPVRKVQRAEDVRRANYQPVPEPEEDAPAPEVSDPLGNVPVPGRNYAPGPPPETINPQPTLTAQASPAPLPTPDFSNTTDPFITGNCVPGACDDTGYFLTPQSVNWIHPYLNLGIKGGDRVIGDGLLFVPLFQTDDSLFYGHARYQNDNRGATEGNFGLGYREIIDDHWIAGVYASYDHLYSQYRNAFDQATVGAELMTVDWDFRVNGYFPEMGGKFVNAQAAIVNGNIVVNNFEERAYRGVDAEIGYRLFYWGVNDDFEVRLFSGGFYLNNSAQGFDEIAGPKSRLEFRAYDLNLFGFQSRFEAGIESSWDRVRNEEFYGFARLRIPLHSGQRAQLSPLRRRLTDLPVRDPDIVTNRAVGLRERAFNAQTGQTLGKVHRATAETDLTSLFGQAQKGDVLLLDGSQGSIAVPFGESLVMKDGQSLLGGGSRLLLAGEQTGRVVTFTLPGTSPTLMGSMPPEDSGMLLNEAPPPAAPLLTLANQTLVQGITFDGGSIAIFGNQVSQSLIRDVQIRNTSEAGIELNNSGNITIARANIQDPGQYGLNVVQGAGIILTQSSISGSEDSAVRFENVDTAAIVQTTLSNVGVPTDENPDGKIVPAIELINVKDIGILQTRVTASTQAVDVTGLTGLLSLESNVIDMTDPPADVPGGTPLTAINIDGIGSQALVSITSNTITLNRVAGQTAILMNLDSTHMPPGPGLSQGIVQIAENEFLNISGRGIELNSTVPATVTFSSNQLDYPQIGLPGGLPVAPPGPFFVTSTDSFMELEISENIVTAGLGTVVHQSMESGISAFNSDLTLDLRDNRIPISFMSIFRDGTETFDVEVNSGNNFPLQLAPGSEPIP